jgi:outer membrane protein with beta-barrel domain
MNVLRSASRYLAPSSAAVIVTLSLAPAASALAADVLGLYVGGAIGEAQVEAGNLPNANPVVGAPPTSGSFKANHSAYKVMVGLRPISRVGVEVAYVDFGHPSRMLGTIPPGFPVSGDVHMRGPAAFGILYLPVPVVDIYLKAGIARLQTTANATLTVTAPYATCVVSGGPNCQFSKQNDVTNTGFAAGAGVQFKVRSLAVRGEYERFGAAGGNSGLFSLGLTWSFL